MISGHAGCHMSKIIQHLSFQVTVTLGRGYTCDFLPALATQHPQNCSETDVKGGCTCSQVPSISATCCKKFNVPTILLQNVTLPTCAIFWFYNPCNITKKCCVSSARKNVQRVATVLGNNDSAYLTTSHGI